MGKVGVQINLTLTPLLGVLDSLTTGTEYNIGLSHWIHYFKNKTDVASTIVFTDV